MVVFDLDNTLFKTPLFKQDIYKVFIAHGIDPEVFWKTFYLSYDIEPQSKGCYSLQKHFSILNVDSPIVKQEISSKVTENVYTRGREYLYVDVLPTILELKRRDEKVVLLTKGDKESQELKLDATHIREYFDEIKIVSDNKLPVLKELSQKNKVLVNINNHPDELRVCSSKIPQIICFLIKRSDYPIGDSTFSPSVENLSEIIDKLKHKT
ncbi:MAG: HAD family hydrolase [Patescibacteria group bacterium]